MGSRFDAEGYLTFDLRAGQVRTRGGQRVLVLPASALAALSKSAAGEVALRTIGESLASEVAKSLGVSRTTLWRRMREAGLA